MELYGHFSAGEPVAFYARDPQHIVDLVQHYYDQTKQENRLDDPQIAQWSKKVPVLDDIKIVEKGIIRYHVGMVFCETDDEETNADLFSERMQVTDDFIVAVSPESVFYFDGARQGLPNIKRGELYKFQTGGIFRSLTFIPEDVMQGIVNYDLAPHKRRAEEFQAKIQAIKKGHPGLRI